MLSNQLKYLLLFLLIFLLGAQTSHAKTELVLPKRIVSFSIKQSQSFYSLENELQPNIGFLIEKTKIEVSESISPQNQHEFSKSNDYYLAKAGSDILPEVFGGARQYVRTTYPNGQEILNNLTQKFGNNQGAAAEIIKKFGDDGLTILNKTTVNSIDDAAKELIQGKTLYRYVNETSYNFDKLLTKGQIDAAPSQFPGYTTLDNITDASQAKSILQLPKQPNWVAEFDATQIINDVSFPMGNFNNASYKEIITRSYPDYGAGGGSQFITTSQIKISKLRNLNTGEVIDFSAVNKYKGQTKKYIIDNANDDDWTAIFSGKTYKVNNPDPSAQALSSRFTGESGVVFGTDPVLKEFDFITDNLIIEHKLLSTTSTINAGDRYSYRYLFQASKKTNRSAMFIFEGVKNDSHINKIVQYANEYQINTVIELNGTIIHNITF